MAEDIITALSHFKALFVIARNSSFTYKGRAIDIKQVGRELGVRTYWKGAFVKRANQVRITGKLVDTATGYIFGQTDLMVRSTTSSIYRIG